MEGEGGDGERGASHRMLATLGEVFFISIFLWTRKKREV